MAKVLTCADLPINASTWHTGAVMGNRNSRCKAYLIVNDTTLWRLSHDGQFYVGQDRNAFHNANNGWHICRP